MIQPVFRERDLLTVYLQPDLDFKVQRYSWSVFGGPKQAVIDAYGSDTDLWRLMEMIRNGVWIYDSFAVGVWWGYLAEVKLVVKTEAAIRDPNLNYRVAAGVSVDSFSNRMAIAYTKLVAGEDHAGERATTDWVQDDDSVGEYGIKELLLTEDNATQSHAEDARDTYLEQYKYPIAVIDTANEDTSHATLVCRGLWDTLGWQYYSNANTDEVESTEQINDILTAEGQFFIGIDIEDASGKNTNEFRDGDATALYYVNKLLERGTSNQKRLNATITSNRRAIIFEEPARDNMPYLVAANGDYFDPYNAQVRKETCPVGIWARMKDIIPPSVDTSAIAAPSPFFIEENEYVVAEDKLYHIARGQPDAWEFPTIKDG